MTSEELAQEIRNAGNAAAYRVLTAGHAQYDEAQGQAFERYDMDRLFDETDDELTDLIAYLVMVRIRIRRIQNSV